MKLIVNLKTAQKLYPTIRNFGVKLIIIDSYLKLPKKEDAP